MMGVFGSVYPARGIVLGFVTARTWRMFVVFPFSERWRLVFILSLDRS